MMQTSDAGLDLIRTEEGLTLTVTGDAGGKEQIGYGHDLLPGEWYPHGITAATAEELLRQDVAKCEAVLNRLVPAACTQGQFDALIDFTYECGAGALETLLAHGWNQVPWQLPRWAHAQVNGAEVELPGMVARREAEVTMFEG